VQECFKQKQKKKNKIGKTKEKTKPTKKPKEEPALTSTGKPRVSYGGPEADGDGWGREW